MGLRTFPGGFIVFKNLNMIKKNFMCKIYDLGPKPKVSAGPEGNFARHWMYL